MSLSLYAVTVPPMRAMLKNLSSLLAKADSHCEARKIDPEALLASRLYPDMFPLRRQVQIVSDNVKGSVARLAGAEIPKFEDDEVSFADLQRRIDKTLAFLDSVAETRFEDAATRPVVLQMPNRKVEFANGVDYLNTWVNPNFYFHVTTVYALLRHGGVDIGKADYLRGGVTEGK